MLSVLGDKLLQYILIFLSDYWLTPGPPMIGDPRRFWDLDDPEILSAITPVLRLGNLKSIPHSPKHVINQ